MMQKKSQLAITALQYMQTLYGDYPLSELEYTSPFQLLVAVILSAQTTDKQVNKVTAQFFRVVKKPEDIVKLGEPGVKEYIKTVGLHTAKTVNLVKMAGMLVESGKLKSGNKTPLDPPLLGGNIKESKRQYRNAEELFQERGYRIPDTIEEITKLPGVGIKTAKVVLYILYGQKRVAVDTHVHRVMNRIGIVTTKSPDQTSLQLEKIIPDDWKDVAHKVIIYFGRYRCTAKNPNCAACKLQQVCRWYKYDSKKKK